MQNLLEGLPTRYRARQFLGRGGMGLVLGVHDQELDREVALKLLHLAPDPEVRERFRREALALARLSCRQVVEVYDFEADGPKPWLCMEWVRGKDLRRAPPEDPLAVYREVAEGLAAVHAAGLIHRDVKPANIVQTAEGRVLLLDFGLVAGGDLTQLTASGHLVGTLGYMAPEVMLGASASPASDWYSWGASFFLALEGRDPFDDATLKERLTGTGDPWSEVPPKLQSVPEASRLSRLVQACLAPDPSRRPAGIGEVRAALAAPYEEAPRAAAPVEERHTEVLEAPSTAPAGTASGPQDGSEPPPGPEPDAARSSWASATGLAVLLGAAGGALWPTGPRYAPTERPAPTSAPEEYAPTRLSVAAELLEATRQGSLQERYETHGVGAYRELDGYRAVLQVVASGGEAPLDAVAREAADGAAESLGWVVPFGVGWALEQPPEGWEARATSLEGKASRAHRRLETRAHKRPETFPGARTGARLLLNPEARVLLALGEARRAGQDRVLLDTFLAEGRELWVLHAAAALRAVEAAPASLAWERAQARARELHRTRLLTYGSLCGAAPLQLMAKAPRGAAGRFLVLEVEEALADVAQESGILAARDEQDRARDFRALAEDEALARRLRQRAWLRALAVAWLGGLRREAGEIDAVLRGELEEGLGGKDREWLAGARRWVRGGAAG